MPSPTEIVRALHRAIEEGLSGEALRPYFTDDAWTDEQPNVLKPVGAKASLAQMLVGSQAGAALLRSQRYDPVFSAESGSIAILRVRWTGVIGRDAGPFKAGQELVAHVAQFVDTRDGKVASITTYDCFEPFPRAD